jgi:hypothetical protein
MVRVTLAGEVELADFGAKLAELRQDERCPQRLGNDQPVVFDQPASNHI